MGKAATDLRPGAAATLLALATALLACCGTTETAAAKGMGQLAASSGVTVSGSPYRYAAMSPNVPRTRTVLVRTDREGGRIDRWWYLPGTYVVPAVAYDLSAGGLSADGSTLVLSRFSATYPPPVSRFAILDTKLRLRHPWDPPEHRAGHAVTHVALRGDFSFDAISPDGSTVYLTQRLPRHRGPAYIANHTIRALDVSSGELRPQPIADPRVSETQVEGVPITRAASPDGRWTYTLYDGNARAEDGGDPFVDALDTARGRMTRIDLPQLASRRNLFMLKLRIERGGRALSVLAPRARHPGLRPLLTIDTLTFAVSGPTATAAGDPPWPPLAIAHFLRETGDAIVGAWTERPAPSGGFLDFALTPRRPGNLLMRIGAAGRSAEGRKVFLRQYGDPARAGELLVFGCVHGDECAARHLRPITQITSGCPDWASDIYVVGNLNPDGEAIGSRLNGRGVDLNRNFPAGWEPIGERWDPQFSGPKPFSEPETRLAARIVERLRPEVTIWFHQHHAPRPLVRAWGGSVPAARRFAALAELPFRRLPWPAGTAPHWQNERFPGSSSFVVEMPRGELPDGRRASIERALLRLGRELGRVGED